MWIIGGPEMAPRRGPGRCEICGIRLEADRVGSCCGKCHRMTRRLLYRDHYAMNPKQPGTDVYDAYILGPAPSPEHIRQRARDRAKKSESEMSRILRQAAALGMQYGEYMIYLKTRGETP